MFQIFLKLRGNIIDALYLKNDDIINMMNTNNIDEEQYWIQQLENNVLGDVIWKIPYKFNTLLSHNIDKIIPKDIKPLPKQIDPNDLIDHKNWFMGQPKKLNKGDIVGFYKDNKELKFIGSNGFILLLSCCDYYKSNCTRIIIPHSDYKYVNTSDILWFKI